MKKSEIELDMSVELILVIAGLIILLILIAAIFLNLETLRDFFENTLGEIF